jgi:acetylornithine deacetylase/succinyl-diaminopimelate desuccinylase-like protein
MPRSPRNVIELLQELVAIPSVNPGGNPGTDGVGEEKLARYVGSFLKACGAQVRFQEIEAGRPNVFATFPSENGAAPKWRLAFAPHSDTVSVLGMTIPPFNPEIRNGRLYGRGASDTKGSLAAFMWGIKSWAQSKARARSNLEVTLAALMGEEHGNDGAKAWMKSKPRIDFAIIGEPTSWKVVHAHKGAMFVSAEASGKACHASTPRRGRNAVLAMSRAAVALDALAKKWSQSPKFRHPALGAPTLTPSVIRGGSKVNIVPDHCRLEIDVRTVPSVSTAACLAEVKEALGKSARVVDVRESPPLDTDRSHPVAVSLRRHARGWATAPWFCDASILAAHGIPAIAIGPGSIAQAHTADEWISTQEVIDAAQKTEAFLHSLG